MKQGWATKKINRGQ